MSLSIQNTNETLTSFNINEQYIIFIILAVVSITIAMIYFDKYYVSLPFDSDGFFNCYANVDDQRISVRIHKYMINKIPGFKMSVPQFEIGDGTDKLWTRGERLEKLYSAIRQNIKSIYKLKKEENGFYNLTKIDDCKNVFEDILRNHHADLPFGDGYFFNCYANVGGNIISVQIHKNMFNKIDVSVPKFKINDWDDEFDTTQEILDKLYSSLKKEAKSINKLKPDEGDDYDYYNLTEIDNCKNAFEEILLNHQKKINAIHL